MDNTSEHAPDVAQAALRGLCPKCGAPGLFAGVVRFSERCKACGLEFSRFNVGDGPAAFLIMIVGGLVVMGAAILHLNYALPFLVQALIWFPVTIALVIGLLRLSKGALIVLEYRNQAAEGRLSE